MTALYSQKNAAQSRTRSVATLRIGPADDAVARPRARQRAARPRTATTRQWSSISATTGAVAAKTPAARSSGIAIGSSKESSFTDGQRSRTAARVASSVQSATTTSAPGQRSARASRHLPRYGMPLTDAITTDSRRARRSSQRVQMAHGLAGRPGDVEGEERRQRREQASTEAAAREHLARRPCHEHERHDDREHDAGDVPARRRSVRRAGGRRRARARAAAGRTRRTRRSVPGRRRRRGRARGARRRSRSARFTSGSQNPSRNTLPRPLEQLAPVGAVVAGDLRVLTPLRTAACRARSGRSTRPSRRRAGRRPGRSRPRPPRRRPAARAGSATQSGAGRIGEIVSATRHPAAASIPSRQSSGTSAPERSRKRTAGYAARTSAPLAAGSQTITSAPSAWPASAARHPSTEPGAPFEPTTIDRGDGAQPTSSMSSSSSTIRPSSWYSASVLTAQTSWFVPSRRLSVARIAVHIE